MADGANRCFTPEVLIHQGLDAFDSSSMTCVLATEFTQFVEEHGTRLYWFAYRKCGDATQAEDLVQMSYLKLWSKWTEFHSSTSEHRKALAYNAITWAHIDYVRKRSNQFAPSDLADYDVADDSVVDAELIAAENAREVLQAVEKLPDILGEVITAIYFEGSTQAAFAAEQGLTPKLVSRYHIKALQRLREILGER